MFPFPKLTPQTLPFKLFAIAALLLAPALPSRADDCKPRIDKNNLSIELGIPGYNGGRRFSVVVPLGSKEGVTGGGAAARFVNASARTGSAPAPANVAYNLRVTERRDHGAMLELTVLTHAPNGTEQTLRRTMYIEHDRIVEQIYLGGVSLKAGFKVLPFKCKKG
jgi:hypothetical protein